MFCNIERERKMPEDNVRWFLHVKKKVHKAKVIQCKIGTMEVLIKNKIDVL